MKRFFTTLTALLVLLIAPASPACAETEDYLFTFRSGIVWGASPEEVMALGGAPDEGMFAQAIKYAWKLQDHRTLILLASIEGVVGIKYLDRARSRRTNHDDLHGFQSILPPFDMLTAMTPPGRRE